MFLGECSQAEKRGHKSTDPLFSQVRAQNRDSVNKENVVSGIARKFKRL